MPIRTSNSPRRRIANDFNAFDGVDVGMHVAHAHAVFVEVFGQVLGHLFGEGGDERAHAAGGDVLDFRHDVVDLGGAIGGDGADFNRRIDEAGRADDLAQ